MSKQIYLDHAATTPVDEKVLEKMKPYFGEFFGNASSIHSFGRKAKIAVEEARKNIANFFGADSQEIIFTSGATEANNLAIKGLIRSYYLKSENKNKKPHIITSAFEHHCVLDTIKNLEKEGLTEATFINPKKDGIIDVNDIEKSIKSNTILISVMYVNNEIGTVQLITQIGKMIKSKNNEQGIMNKIIFHTDATQAINYFDCNTEKLGVDLLSMSAHKIYGPKGIGILYIKKGTSIKKMQDGGSQEFDLRAGTLNVPGIIGLEEALQQVKNEKLKVKNKIEKLRNYLIKRVLQEIPKVKLNGSKIKRSPNNANFSFLGVEGESLLLMLDAEGIFASTGSACSSGELSPSHVLLSLGMKPEEAHGSLRLTLGKDTTKAEINYVIKILKKSVENLQRISGNILKDYYKGIKHEA